MYSQLEVRKVGLPPLFDQEFQPSAYCLLPSAYCFLLFLIRVYPRESAADYPMFRFTHSFNT
jgi:hypothetical protein